MTTATINTIKIGSYLHTQVQIRKAVKSCVSKGTYPGRCKPSELAQNLISLVYRIECRKIYLEDVKAAFDELPPAYSRHDMRAKRYNNQVKWASVINALKEEIRLRNAYKEKGVFKMVEEDFIYRQQ